MYKPIGVPQKGYNWTSAHIRIAKGGILTILTSYIRHGEDHLNHTTLQQIHHATSLLNSPVIWVGDFNRPPQEMQEEHAHMWNPLTPDVESTCRGGGLIDYALLTTEATYFTTSLGIIEDAPRTPHFPIVYGIMADPHRIKVPKLHKPKPLLEPDKPLEPWGYHHALKWINTQPKLHKINLFNNHESKEYNINKAQRLYNDATSYRKPSYLRAKEYQEWSLVATVQLATTITHDEEEILQKTLEAKGRGGPATFNNKPLIHKNEYSINKEETSWWITNALQIIRMLQQCIRQGLQNHTKLLKVCLQRSHKLLASIPQPTKAITQQNLKVVSEALQRGTSDRNKLQQSIVILHQAKQSTAYHTDQQEKDSWKARVTKMLDPTTGMSKAHTWTRGTNKAPPLPLTVHKEHEILTHPLHIGQHFVEQWTGLWAQQAAGPKPQGTHQCSQSKPTTYHHRRDGNRGHEVHSQKHSTRHRPLVA